VGLLKVFVVCLVSPGMMNMTSQACVCVGKGVELIYGMEALMGLILLFQCENDGGTAA
jgi:hypothetical protein